MSAAAFRQLLEAGDVHALRSAWAKVAPHLPQPDTFEKAEMAMHMARTVSSSVRFRFRAYSHSWLMERGLPSQLPDDLKPKAERMYPKIVRGVGIAVRTRNEFLKPVISEVRHAMENAVLEAEADGKLEDAAHVTMRMKDARTRVYKHLVGSR